MSFITGSILKGRKNVISIVVLITLILSFPLYFSEHVEAIDDINFDKIGNITKSEHIGQMVISVDISPDGNKVAYGLNNGTVYVYNVKDWQIYTVFKSGNGTYDIEWCPNQDMGMIAVSMGTEMGHYNGIVKIYSTSTWNLIEEFEYDHQVYSISWNNNGSFLAVAAINVVDILNTDDWTVEETVDLDKNLSHVVEWHPVNNQLAIGKLNWDSGGSVDLYVPGTGVIYSYYIGFENDELFNPSVLEWDTINGWLGIANSSLRVIDPVGDLEILNLHSTEPIWISDLVWINNSNQLVVANGTIAEIHDINNGSKELLIDLPKPHPIKMMTMAKNEGTLYICQYSSLYIIELKGFKNGQGDLDDDDSDGVVNSEDSFPTDVAASIDNDEDGYPDEWNPNRNESHSTTGLKLDVFPTDPGEWFDSDSDSIGNNADGFPFDPAAWEDSDGDGFPDRWNPGKSEEDSTTGLKIDAFPMDGSEWADLDDDGKGDNSDLFPTDPGEWADSDLDGYGNNGDAFPTDPAASMDSDDDGYPDSWNPGMTEDNSTTGLVLDRYPLDPQKHTAGEDFKIDPIWIYVPIILFTILIILLLAFTMIAKSRKKTDRSLSLEEERIKKYRQDILQGNEEGEFILPDDELLEILSRRKSEGDISEENYTFIIEKVLGDQ